MKENRLTVVIEKPVAEVFEFTTNPKNTPSWIPQVKKEISDNYPPEINTIYKNTGTSGEWNSYIVVEFERDLVFTLAELDNNYHVRYSYKKLNDKKTELHYFEWVEKGELKMPFKERILQNLKKIMEGESR